MASRADGNKHEEKRELTRLTFGFIFRGKSGTDRTIARPLRVNKANGPSVTRFAAFLAVAAEGSACILHPLFRAPNKSHRTAAGTDRLRAGSRSATVPPLRSTRPPRMLLQLQERP
jgi:hypothetical protein